MVNVRTSHSETDLQFDDPREVGSSVTSFNDELHRRADVDHEFCRLVNSGALELPLPSEGATRVRWAALSEIAAEDLCVARLAEAHLDALAILHELHVEAPSAHSRWGVWASRPPAPALVATPRGDGWRLDGEKLYCSGARICTDALVTASSPDGYRLFAVDMSRGPRPLEGTWHAMGMAGSDSLNVEFINVPARSIGDPLQYLHRPGFWYGAMAVAACWYGGAIGLARTLLDESRMRDVGPHALAHLGAIDAQLSLLGESFDAAAKWVDDHSRNDAQSAEYLATRLRAQTEIVVGDVMTRVGRALGAGPLCHNGRHARLAADLPVYVRQSHAESDLARLGSLITKRSTSW